MPKFVRTLKILGVLSVFYVAGGFLYGVAVLIYSGQYLFALHLSLVTAIPFLVVSLMRVLIDSPRPYEVFDIPELEEMRKRRKRGKSFPSRHVFSAFLIGTLWLYFNTLYGIAAIILGSFIAIERVILGIHFPKDVIAGAAVGILSGIIGILVL
jgi:membrane-associated phospholipid phosphatase